MLVQSHTKAILIDDNRDRLSIKLPPKGKKLRYQIGRTAQIMTMIRLIDLRMRLSKT